MIQITFTGSISNNILTVSTTPTGVISVGSTIQGIGILPNTRILSFGTGTGGIGTYYITKEQNVLSSNMTINGEIALINDQQTLNTSAIVSMYQVDIDILSAEFTASIAGTVLTVTLLSSNSGSLQIGYEIIGLGVAPGTKIVSFGTGAGADGTYNLDISNTVSSTSMRAYTIFRFTNEKNSRLNNIVWQGVTYLAYPIEVKGFEVSGSGQFPRPTLKVSNYAAVMSGVAKQYADLVGVKVTRKRTRLKYLDAVNFARRNIPDFSEQLDNNYWAAGKSAIVTITPNSDGIAEKFTVGTWTTGQTIGGGVNNLTSLRYLVFTIEVKKGSGRYISMTAWNGANVVRPRLDLDNVVATSTLYEGTGATTLPVLSQKIVSLPDGYIRWSVVIDNNTSALLNFRELQFCDSTGQVVGNTTGMYHWVRKVQVEEGSIPTEYQLTTTTHHQSADPNTYYIDDVYYVNRKTNENRIYVEWELTSALDISGVKLPRRQIIQNTCAWKYRSTECSYAGSNYYDTNDTQVAQLSNDVCGKRLSSCKLRFPGTNAILPYGGFPGAALTV